jgi:hypothetical protein
MAENDGGTADLGEEFCEECNVRRKVDSITNLDNDRKLKRLACGHEMTQIIKISNDTVGITEQVLPFTIRDPIAEIKRAESERDYFKIVVYSCAVFEFYGRRLLVWNAEKTAHPLYEKDPDDMKLHGVIIELEKRGIIDGALKGKLERIKGLRTKFTHKNKAVVFEAQLGTEVMQSLPDVYDCLTFLKGEYEKGA